MILARHRATLSDTQIDLGKSNPVRPALALRELFEHGLDHPTGSAGSAREEGHDGAVRAQEAVERRGVRGDVHGCYEGGIRRG